MVEIAVAALGVLAAIVTGVYTVKAARAERAERPVPTAPTVHVRGGKPAPGQPTLPTPAPRRSAPPAAVPGPTAPPAPVVRAVTPPPGQQVLPLVSRKSEYAGKSEQDLQIALLTDANFMLQQGDTFVYRKMRSEEEPA
ncbi:hypothetical protein ABZ436_19240 [Micromonospora matsumotoense]|uniref:hypothetical protein n=1 Tax=Micromonospora matsumotoense TaxID=121616 RepID=UPI0033CEA815